MLGWEVNYLGNLSSISIINICSPDRIWPMNVLLDIDSRPGLRGMKNFGGLIFGTWCYIIFLCSFRLQPFSQTSYYFLWLLYQYALCAVVLLIFWCRFTIGYYLFSTPQCFIFYFLYSFSFYFGSSSSSSSSFRKSFFLWIPFLSSSSFGRVSSFFRLFLFRCIISSQLLRFLFSMLINTFLCNIIHCVTMLYG